MLTKRRKVTLKDLAERTGVSPTAISYILNDRLGHVRVSEQTKVRVKAVAEELGYVPRSSARAMVTQRSFCVALIASLADAPMKPATAIYYANALQGVEEICKELGYHCLYASCGLGDANQFTMPRLMKDGSVDGVIIVGHASSAVVRRIKDMGLPCVSIGSNIDPRIGIDRVYPDLNQGVELVAHHLAALGHRKVELILPTGPGPRMHMRHFLSLEKKIEGFQPVSGMVAEEWGTVEKGMERAKFWLDKPDAPTAFICSPIHAEGLVAGFESAHRRFPRDYSLVVFLPEESGELKLGHTLRRVTTLTFPMHEIARHAAMNLFQQLGMSPESISQAQEKLACSLQDGESCGPLRR